MSGTALPAVCWAVILEYVDDVDAARTATATQAARGAACRERCSAKAKLVRSLDAAVVDLFGGRENVARLPTVAWDDRFVGDTGYIAKLRASDMPAAMAVGMDGLARPFVAMRSRLLKADEEDGGEPLACDATDRRTTVDVLFQRYPHTTKAWSNACNGGSGLPIRCGHFLSDGRVCDEFLAENLANLMASRRRTGRPKPFTTKQRTFFTPYVDVVELRRLLV
jgi:hypothetical protein